METRYIIFTLANIEDRHAMMVEKKEKCPNCVDKICHYCAVNKTKKDEWICDNCYGKMDIQDLEE
jgi:hypothetical protein